MKLYYSPRTRALRPRWLLEEIAEPYTIERLDMQKGEHRSEAYKKIHPHGAVPALVDEDLHLFESSAICLYLADKFAERALAPAIGSHDRGRYYQWMVYSVATFEPPILEFAAAKNDAKAAETARARFDEVARVVSAALEGKTWILGEKFSAADVMMGSLALFASSLKLLTDHPTLSSYADRCKQRPAFLRARAD
ncbi:MAG TPA: glutathione S-transferase family protein [Polyangia bacterium]|nr:glutathione S-transferase family protein [Polyangia bacterium]